MFTGKISKNANYDKGNFLSGQISIENLKKNVIFFETFEPFDVASDLTGFLVHSNKYFIPCLHNFIIIYDKNKFNDTDKQLLYLYRNF